MDENNIKQAQAAYDTLCNMLDGKGMKYEKNEDEFKIICTAVGDDLPIRIRMTVNPEKMLISLISSMPFNVPENRRAEMAVAVSCANYGMPDGSFDYDILDGDIVFRMTSCYRDSLIGKELFEYMLFASFGTIDKYNDVFLRVAVSDMSVDEIVKTVK